jgi:hypothetical protein
LVITGGASTLPIKRLPARTQDVDVAALLGLDGGTANIQIARIHRTALRH